MNKITAAKIQKEIANSKFACNCVGNDYAFDIIVEGVKLEIRPYRRKYCDNGAVAHAKGWSDSEDICFDINF